MSKENLAFVGYITGGGLSELTEIQAKKLTHLNIAFAPMIGDITSIEPIRNKMKYVKEIKQYNPKLNILISTGGGDNHGHGEATRTEEGLNKLVKSTMDIVEEFDLDGIDCDWEFPGDTGIIEEKYQQTALFKKYREELDKLEVKNNKKYWLTTAAGCGQWYIDRTEISMSHKYLDFINLMTYDLGGWNVYAGPHSGLYEPKNSPIKRSADTFINLIVDAGVPKEKILIGVAFYSHYWEGISTDNNGINQHSKEGSTFGPDYTSINLIYENNHGYIKYWDDASKSPYLFNGDTLISYDDEISIKYKCEYVKAKGLKGAFYWQHGADKTSKLFNSIYDNLFL